MLENDAQIMELSDLLSDELLSFCGDFDTDNDIDAIFATWQLVMAESVDSLLSSQI